MIDFGMACRFEEGQRLDLQAAESFSGELRVSSLKHVFTSRRRPNRDRVIC